ncbi:MAG TPA: hypothetical protein VLL98_02855 [Rickettsiales bacterium]|nr:hypothetical protein [Rickettsiales bacterium]
MLEHNLKDGEENLIPQDIQQEIQARAYETGRQQGFDWFKNHTIDALNLVLPENKQLNKDFKLTNGITEIFEGNNNLPPIEYICYEYWLKHQKYERVAKALDEVRNIQNSIVEKVYKEEAQYFLKRLTKREEIQTFKDMFLKYSKDYLVDETVKHVLIQQWNNRNLEFYYLGTEPRHDTVFLKEKAQSNNIIKNYIGNELLGITNGNWITLREKNEQ